MSGLDGFNLQLPLVCAPMFLVSGRDMAVAASEAGIDGAFPSTNCRTQGELEQWLTQSGSTGPGQRGSMVRPLESKTLRRGWPGGQRP